MSSKVRIIADKALEGGYKFIVATGESTTTKPTGKIANGSAFLEADTGDVYLWRESNKTWVKQ